MKAKKWHKDMTVQVLAAIAVGALFGHYFPDIGAQMKPLGDAFIRMIKMVIGPIIFLTIVTGISGMGDMKKVGKVGGIAILYFEIVTTFALALGLLVVNLSRPGDGLNMESIAKGDISKYADKAGEKHSMVDFFVNIIPENAVGAFANGDLLQILFISLLFGAALSKMGEKGKPIEQFFEKLATALFGVIEIVMKVAFIGAFGAIAYTVGKFGLASLIPLGKLIFDVFLTMVIFIVCVIGGICWYYKFSVFKFIRYIREELLIVLGTSSSESVLPRMMEKLEHFGCSKSVVGLVLPTGYSFNLDGTSIYLSMAAIFIAQAYGIELSLVQQLTILGILMVTSKGAAGVTGSGFIVLGATLAATHVLPVEGMALLLGVDRFMSTARALTNLIGNAVATVVVAKIQKEFDEEKALAEYEAYFGRKTTL